MKKTKFAAVLMIVAAGSVMTAASANAEEEVKAAFRERHGYVPPPRESRETHYHREPGGHRPSHIGFEFERHHHDRFGHDGPRRPPHGGRGWDRPYHAEFHHGEPRRFPPRH